jgi:hypothetical protein
MSWRLMPHVGTSHQKLTNNIKLVTFNKVYIVHIDLTHYNIFNTIPKAWTTLGFRLLNINKV